MFNTLDKIKSLINNNKIILFVGLVIIVLSVVAVFPRTLPQIRPTTTPSISPSPAIDFEQAGLQSAADYEFNQSMNKTLKDFPFITKLPLITTKYTILYDFTKDVIRVRMKPNITSQSIATEVQTQLDRIGVPRSIKIVYLKSSDPIP
jgi:hypothetical protein